MAKRVCCIVMAFGTALFLLASVAFAREAVRENFEDLETAVAPGKSGKGLTRKAPGLVVKDPRPIDLPVSLGGALRGAISFDLQRQPGEFADDRSVFAFLDGQDNALFEMEIAWVSEFDPTKPMIFLRGDLFNEIGIGMWSKWILLDGSVKPGDWVRFDLQWDDEAGSYRLFVDGRAQDVRPKRYDSATGAEIPDYRVDYNAELVKRGQPPLYNSGAFASIASRTNKIRFGIHTRPSDPRTGTSPLVNAVLDNFAVYVDEIPPPGAASAPIAISAVENNAFEVAGFSGKLVAGNRFDVTVRGTRGGAGSFDIVHFPDFDRRIELDWRGWGVYLEDKVFFEAGEVNLRDVEEYRVYAGPKPLGAITAETVPLETLEPGVQSYVLEHLEIDTPLYTAVYALMRDGTLRPVLASRENLPLAETEPGVYTGVYTVTYQDRLPRAVVVGRLTRGEMSASLAGDRNSTLTLDPALTIAVATEPGVLKADEKSTAKVSVTVTDANGNAVSGHKMKFVLATTSQYTGVVGGGAFTDQVGGSITESRWGETDLFGKLSAKYVAGFAAKTAVIVVRDMASNDTGAGYVKTFITATAQLELLPVRDTAAMDAGYTITVTSSDEWLTADGKSQARITAKVALNGRPVEGHKIVFAVASGAGSIRAVKDTTDRNGEARAVYTAGKKIGIALITATDSTAGISGSVQIELRSDAPAKIAIKLDPEKLPADGRSRAELTVLVTDINDNPNDNTEVEYVVASGGGGLREAKDLTDRNGESTNTYTAGSSPGLVSIDITVRSTVPTAAELEKARGLAVAVTDYKFF